MVTEKTLERINELYHKSKAEGLTDAELAEQKQLRADYVKAFRENLRGQLESIKIKNPDGSLIDVKARHDEKMKRLAEDQAEKILTSAKEDFKEEKEQHEKTIENYQKLIRKLESDYQSYKARMKQFINGQMDILDNPVYEMEFEIAGCEQTDGDEEDEQQKQFGNEQ